MILKASQRGNTKELADHLMNTKDNDRVRVHRVDGFIGDSVHDAFAEVEAISRGTRCKQPLFSVSLNPPKGQSATIASFEAAVEQIAERNNLTGQPHIMVFHEKEGRLHAHCVWSRIDADSMTAINLSFYKNRLCELSKELYLEHGWDLPDGHKNKTLRNPLNFTLAQWQQAKRLNEDPKQIKLTLKECWITSDSRKAFETALDQHGFTLAKGDRRGFVAVDWRGEVFSLSKWAGVKTKELKTRLGEPKELANVEQVQARLDQTLKSRVDGFLLQIHQRYQSRFKPLQSRKQDMNARHDREREALSGEQKQQETQIIQMQKLRFRTGMRGLWDRVTGKHKHTAKQNETERYQAFKIQQEEKDALIYRQLEQRRLLQERFDALKAQQRTERENIKQAIFQKLPDEKVQTLHHSYKQQVQRHDRGLSLDM